MHPKGSKLKRLCAQCKSVCDFEVIDCFVCGGTETVTLQCPNCGKQWRERLTAKIMIGE